MTQKTDCIIHRVLLGIAIFLIALFLILGAMKPIPETEGVRGEVGRIQHKIQEAEHALQEAVMERRHPNDEGQADAAQGVEVPDVEEAEAAPQQEVPSPAPQPVEPTVPDADSEDDVDAAPEAPATPAPVEPDASVTQDSNEASVPFFPAVYAPAAEDAPRTVADSAAAHKALDRTPESRPSSPRLIILKEATIPAPGSALPGRYRLLRHPTGLLLCMDTSRGALYILQKDLWHVAGTPATASGLVGLFSIQLDDTLDSVLILNTASGRLSRVTFRMNEAGTVDAALWRDIGLPDAPAPTPASPEDSAQGSAP